MAKNNEITQMWVEILSQEVEIVKSLMSRMTCIHPGTYNPKDLIEEFKLMKEPPEFDRTLFDDIFNSREVHEIKTKDMNVSISSQDILRATNKTLPLAGARGKKIARWSFEREGHLLYSSNIVFPEKRVMSSLSKQLSSKKSQIKTAYLNISDGILVGGFSEESKDTSRESNFTVVKGDVSCHKRLPVEVYELPAKKLKHLYGECRIDVLRDPTTGKHMMRLTNSDGWQVWSLIQVTKTFARRMYQMLNTIPLEPEIKFQEGLTAISELISPSVPHPLNKSIIPDRPVHLVRLKYLPRPREVHRT